MATNVEVEKNPSESAASILRRFTKRVQGAGILPRVKSMRYKLRVQSSYKRKMKTLKNIKRRAEVKQLIKMGKMQEKMPRR